MASAYGPLRRTIYEEDHLHSFDDEEVTSSEVAHLCKPPPRVTWESLASPQVMEDLDWIDQLLQPASVGDELLNHNDSLQKALESHPSLEVFPWQTNQLPQSPNIDTIISSSHSPTNEDVSSGCSEHQHSSSLTLPVNDENHPLLRPSMEPLPTSDPDSFWKSLLEDENSDGSAQSVTPSMSSGSGSGSGMELGQSNPRCKLGWALDMRRSVEKDFCFPDVQYIAPDETAMELMRANGLSFIPRQFPNSKSQEVSQIDSGKCVEGCHCQACDMPRFDFQLINQATEIRSPLTFAKPITVNAPTVEKKRPADMSARLAALVTASTSKPSSKPAILDGSPASQMAAPAVDQAVDLPSAQKMKRVARGRSRVATDGTIAPPNLRSEKYLMNSSLIQGSTMDEQSILRKQLIAFAEAVAMDDQTKAKSLVDLLRKVANLSGSCAQRMTYYCLDAIIARTKGEGAVKFNALPTESPHAMRKAMEAFFDSVPYINFMTESINGCIYDAVVGHKVVHIVDFGVWQGGQWPSLIERLARQPGGAPHLRITAIDCPGMTHPGKKNPINHKNVVGKHLVAVADQLGMTFEYRYVDFSVENFNSSVLGVKKGEALAVSCCVRLRNLYDGSVVRSNPRDAALQQIRKLNPAVVAVAEMDFDSNGYFFMARFKETLDYFSAMLESLDASFPPGSTAHHAVERNIFARDILNVIACEGLQRVIRSERVEQWQQRFRRAGFEPVAFSASNITALQQNLRRCARGFSVQGKGGITTLSWKKRIMLASYGLRPLF